MAPQLEHDPSPPLRRRDFLAYSAGLAVLPTVSWAGRGKCHGLAIGYCLEPSETEGPAMPVVAVERLAAGDPSLARGARITVHGLIGDAAGLARLGIRSVELRVGFPAAGVDPSQVEFLAWSHQLLPVENIGAANAFTVPVDSGLALAVEIETPCSVSAPSGRRNERFEALLSTGREPGEPKLRAGRYLIAPGAVGFQPRRFDETGSEPLIAFSVEPLA